MENMEVTPWRSGFFIANNSGCFLAIYDQHHNWVTNAERATLWMSRGFAQAYIEQDPELQKQSARIVEIAYNYKEHSFYWDLYNEGVLINQRTAPSHIGANPREAMKGSGWSTHLETLRDEVRQLESFLLRKDYFRSIALIYRIINTATKLFTAVREHNSA